MRVLLSPLEVGIILGVRLMFTGVPFTRTEKQALDTHQQQRLDAVWERILQKRDSEWTSHVPLTTNQKLNNVLECELTLAEIDLYIKIIKSCLSECDGDPIELELHLGDRNQNGVELLINKLETTLAAK